MENNKTMPFKRSMKIEAQADEFLDTVSEAALVFEQAIGLLALSKPTTEFEQKLQALEQLEKRGNELRKMIETTLYSEMLIPESRQDVCHLLNDIDAVLNALKKNLIRIWIQSPSANLPQEFHKKVLEMIHMVTQSVEQMVAAARAFFKDIKAVRNYVHKISFFESESDRCVVELAKAVFSSSLNLDQKILICDTFDRIDKVADLAEDVGDHISIYAIKRAL